MNKKIGIVLAIVLISLLAWMLNGNRTVVDLINQPGFGLVEPGQEHQQIVEILQKALIDSEITISAEGFESGVSGVRTDEGEDVWYKGSDINGKEVNVFASFKLYVTHRKLTRLVLESSITGSDDVAMEKLLLGEGNYEVLMGEGYDWIKNPVKGP